MMRSIYISLLLVLITGSAMGQIAHWVGLSGASWHSGSNWSTGSVPTSSTSVNIPGNSTVGISSGAECAKIDIDFGSKLVLTSGGSLTAHGIFNHSDLDVTFDNSANYIQLLDDLWKDGVTVMENEGGVTLYSWPESPTIAM